jgi:hypothetical protein
MTTKALVQKIENGQATIKLPDETLVVWPTEKLPSGITEGMTIVFEIFSEKEHEEKTNKNAKDILNELLDTTP